MINASARFKQNAKAPVKTVQVRMTQVVSEGATPLVYSSADLIQKVKIEASSTWLYSGAKKATVTLVEITSNLMNYAWVVELGIVDPASSQIDYITLGTFYTTLCDFNYDKGTTQLTLYDYMNKAELSWQQGTHENYPKTVATLASDIASNLGYAGVADMTGLPNATQIVQEDLWALISQEKYREVTNEIANITGTTAIVNSQNYLEFKPFRNAEEILTYDNLRTYKLGLHYGKINSVVLSRQPQNDDVALQDSTSIDANGLTEAKIVNNQIADNNRSEFIQPLFNALNGVEFDGIEMNTEGHGWYEIGDSLQVRETPNGEIPKEYQQVEYIESSGTQYINTGFKPTPLTRTRATYAFTQVDTKQQRVFGWQAGSGIWYSQYLNGSRATGFSFQDATGNWQAINGALSVNAIYTFDMDGKARTATSYDASGNVRGTKDMSSHNATKTATGNLHLFCEGRDTTPTNFARLKMYSVKMWDNDQLVRDFVPCYRKIDNVAGMFDKVNGVFYANAGTGTFAIGKEVFDIMPLGYTQVEYVEKTTNVMQNSINTGFVPNINTEFEVSFSVSDKGTYGGVMGASIGSNSQSLATDSGLALRVGSLSSMGTRNWTTDETAVSFDLTEKHTMALMKDGCYLDGVRKYTNTRNTSIVIPNNSPIAIFSILRGGYYAWGNELAKVYHAKIWDNGVLVRDMVPVIRDSDGKVGMLDKVHSVFYGSADRNVFTAGPKITGINTIVVTDLTMTLESGGFKENIKCVTPDLTSTDYTATGGIKKSIYNTEIKTDKQQQEITSIVSRQDQFEDQVTEEFTQVHQDIAGLTVSVQTTGGGNYIKNSVGYSKDSDGNLVNWTKAGNGTFSSETSPESMQAGAISGNQISLFNATLTQRVILAPNIEYTLSYIGKKSVVGTAGITITNSNDTFNLLMPDQTAVYWEKQEITFTPTLGYVDVVITADSNITEFAITDIMLSQGDLSTPWRQADGEILNTQVAVDTEGIRVKSSVYEGDETVMTPLEFAGYSAVSGSREKVFSLNRDTTEVQKVSIRRQMSMPPLKVIPLESPGGWAFVKDEGDN